MNLYDLNKYMSETVSNIPLVGEGIVSAQKATCDYLVNPAIDVIFDSSYSGCDAIDDVYHGLQSVSEIQTENDIGR